MEASSMVVCEEVRLAAHVRHLSSVANPFVKHVVKLRQSSSYRHTSGSLVLIGDVPLRYSRTPILLLLLLHFSSRFLFLAGFARELCDIAPSKLGKKAFIDYLFVLESSNAGEQLAEFAERLVEVTPAVMHKLSGVQSTEGCNAVGLTSMPFSFCSLESSSDSSSALTRWCPCPQRLLALDGIQVLPQLLQLFHVLKTSLPILKDTISIGRILEI